MNPTSYSDSDGTFVVAQPLTPQCAQHLRSREHACLGISPFNSYFTEAQIRRLARWASLTFSTVHFFVPDAAAAHTLEALGYPAKKAAVKARRQGQYLLNKIRRALACLGASRPDELILDSRALTANTRYTQLLADTEHHFHIDPTFATQCLDASRWVLDKRLPDGADPTEQQLRAAARYLLAELPLFIDTAGIVGCDRSVFCYHQSMPFLRQLYKGELSWRPAPHQGFVVITHEEGPAAGRRLRNQRVPGLRGSPR